MKRYETYKDSGVQWLGDIPQHWEVRFLSQVASEYFVSNKNIHHQNLLSLSYGAIVRKDINGTDGLLPASFDTYQVVKDGIIVLRLTDLQNDHRSLRVGIAKEEGIVTSAYTSLQARNTILPNYLYYQLHTNDIHKVFYSMGDGLRQSLNYAGLKRLLMVLPPMAEQEGIVAFLDEKTTAIDDLVAKVEREIELLKEFKQAEIARVVTRGLNPNVPMKPSGIDWIGDIPQHWSIEKVGQNFTERREKVSDKDYPALSVSKEGVTPQLETAVKTNNGDNRKKVCKGDFVVNSRSDRKGSCGFSNFDGSVSLINTVLIPRNNVNGRYYHYVFRSNDFIEEFYRLGRGIVADLWTTRFTEQRNIMIPIPPIEEQQGIVDYIDRKTTEIDRLVVELTYQVEYLREYKQRLIADVVTGKINVQQN